MVSPFKIPADFTLPKEMPAYDLFHFRIRIDRQVCGVHGQRSAFNTYQADLVGLRQVAYKPGNVVLYFIITM